MSYFEIEPVERAVRDEENRQVQKWGKQDHPSGTARPGDKELSDHYKAICQANGQEKDNWRDILAEEVFEAFAESEGPELVKELIQVIAVAKSWIKNMEDRDVRRHTDL